MTSPAETVRITGIAGGGAGIGRLADGRAVFVQRTAPGDVADVRVTAVRGRWARATLVSLRAAGPDRRPAPCAHYERCGGCTLEHLDYAAQLRLKATLVTDALRRIGRIAADLPAVAPSPMEFRYRNRVSFTLQRGAGGVIAGFHELDSPGRVLDISGACLLPEPAIAAAWDALRAGWGPQAQRLPGGPRLRLTLRATAAGVVTLLIEGGRGSGQADALLDAVPALVAIWQQPRSGVTPRLLAGVPGVDEQWGDERIELNGALFLQVNRAAAGALEAYVLELAGAVTGRRVVDAYCGIGRYARRLAAAGAVVAGIELDAHAVAEAKRLAGGAARFEQGRVEEILSRELPCDLLIANPPRAGLDDAIPTALAATPPGRFIYVSCDPATLARDLARLGSTFALRSLRCFDLFPQTAHVETVAELTCATS